MTIAVDLGHKARKQNTKHPSQQFISRVEMFPVFQYSAEHKMSYTSTQHTAYSESRTSAPLIQSKWGHIFGKNNSSNSYLYFLFLYMI